MHVRAAGEVLHGGQPFAAGPVRIAAIRAHAQRAAGVVHHDARLRKRARQVGELRNLRVVKPGVEAEVHRHQPCEAPAEFAVRHLPCRRARQQAGIEFLVARGDVADAPEAAGACGHMGFQHFLDLVAKGQVGRTDDAGARAGGGFAPFGFARDAGDEFGFADTAQRFRPAGAITVAALDEYGGGDAMAGIRIAQQLIEQIPAAAFPEVVMRIDDGEIGFEDLLAILRKPGRIQFGVGDDGQVGGAGHAATTGASPTTVVRCITRRSRGSKAVTWCMVQRLSQISTSSVSQRCR